MVWSQGTSSCGLVGSTKVASGEEVRQGMGTQNWDKAWGRNTGTEMGWGHKDGKEHLGGSHCYGAEYRNRGRP